MTEQAKKTEQAEKTQWDAMKVKIKNQFSKLSDSQIEGLNGHMEKLTNTVRDAYHYDQIKAEKVCNSFNEEIRRSR